MDTVKLFGLTMSSENMRYNIVKYLPLFFLNFIFGQNELTRKTINQYVDYINHCNFYASSSHYSIKNLNIAVARRFEKPKIYALNKQLFERECMTLNVSICDDKLNTSIIEEEYLKLVKNISKLKESEKVELQLSLRSYQSVFNRIVESAHQFSNLKTDESFYLNELKRSQFYDDLDLYKETIEELIRVTETATTLSIELFGEQETPFDIRRSKNIVIETKSILNSFMQNDTLLVDSKLRKLEQIEKEYSLPKQSSKIRAENMRKWGYKDYFGYSHKYKPLVLIDLSDKGIIGWVKRYRIPTDMDIKYPDYGVRNIFDYGRKLKDKNSHAHLHKVEYLTLRLNNISIGPIHKYNNFVAKANQPILKIVEEVVPFYPIRIDIDEKDLIFDQKNIYALDGAKTNNLVLLLDVSGSMSQNGKLKRLQVSISHLVRLLREGDYLTVITYSGVPNVVFEIKGKQDKKELLSKIKQLQSSGRTNFEEGLEKAYNLCQKHWVNQGNNKIIVATDGDFKLKRNEKKRIKNQSDKGFVVSSFHYLTSKNAQKGSKVLMKISKKGGGNYISILEEKDALKAIVNEAKISMD